MLAVSAIVRRATVAAVLSGVLTCAGLLGGGPSSAAPPGNGRGELTFGGLQRTYLVHAPAGNDHPAGLVINLHGSGASGGEQAAIA